MEHNNSAQRFSDRVINYLKYRPGYPAQLISFLKSNLGLKDKHKIADIGSGTGLFSEQLLMNGSYVYCVEPNEQMRMACSNHLSSFKSSFLCIDGTSTNTTLADKSIDFVTVAQAFHWFEPINTRIEFRRILKSDGYVILIWNDRKIAASGFSSDYEDLIKEFGIDYQIVNHKNLDENRIKLFLGDRDYGTAVFNNTQSIDHNGLLGRLVSSSYMPNVGHDTYNSMKNAVRNLFDKYQTNGQVIIAYDTRVYYSRISS